MRRETRQLSLAEALVGGGEGSERLERIAGLIDWAELDGIMSEGSGVADRPAWLAAPGDAKGAAAGAVARAVGPRTRGGASRPAELPALVGLSLGGGVPDETALCRSRGELARRGLTERLLAAIDAQLAGAGWC